MGLENPRSCFSDTPLFALVKLELSVFCKNYALACHRSIGRPWWRKQKLLRIKNYPRKLSRLSKIGLLELSGALQRYFFTAKLSIFCINNPLALHTSVFWPYSRKENLFRIKNYLRKLSWLFRLVFWSCQEWPKECCISGDKELGPGHRETWLWHFSLSANTNMISEKDETF